MTGGGSVERKQFLGRVKSALRGAELPNVVGPGSAPSLTFTDPVERFLAEAAAVASDVTRVPDVASALAAVGAVFDLAETSSFIAWDELEAVVHGWDTWIAESGYTRVDATISTDPDQRPKDTARVGGVSVGITSADWAIAASGSVVLCHGPGRPRSASLLVEHHVVLLPVDRIINSISEVMERVGWDNTSNIAVITGPSRTADIEAVLTLGVHGPRRLHLVVIG
jgi:L-lactate dehydrogenase complex protein LldG